MFLKRTLKRVLAVLIGIGIVFQVPSIPANAIADSGTIIVTAEQAMDWCRRLANNRTSVGVNDGSGQYQCTEFVEAYIEFLLYGRYYNSPAELGASAFRNPNHVPSYMTLIQGAKPQKGDILIYSDSSWGHVAVYCDENTTFHQNYNYKYYVTQEGNYLTSKSSNQTYWGVWRPHFVTNQEPKGDLNNVSSTDDRVYVRGWAYDPDDTAKSLGIHVYVGAPAGSQDYYEVATTTANATRTDVNEVFPGAGNYHGFEFSFTTSLRGNQPVYVYALDTEGGHNPCIGEGTVNITGDVSKPVITYVQITSYDKDGYTITATASDNVGVTSIKFPTWIVGDSTENISFPAGTRGSNGTFTYRVNFAEHQNREGTYVTDVYAYDAAGNVSDYKRITNVVTSDSPTKPINKWVFRDVAQNPGNWKYEAVKYVYENGIMTGTKSNEFQPDAPLTRAMFATMLYRMAGEPKVTYTAKYRDVPDGTWYSDAVIWASQKGIVSGYSNGRFGTKDYITREQIAKMLMEYGKMQGYNVSQRANFSKFVDTGRISKWANDYMKWAVGSGMIGGSLKDGKYYLNPKGNATRAESATMLKRFMEKYQ